MSKDLVAKFNRASRAPQAPRDNSVDIYHGKKVPNPFRPLEDLKSKPTQDFINAHNKRFDKFIGQSPEMDALQKALLEAKSYDSQTMPRQHGKYSFQYFCAKDMQQHVYQVTEEGKSTRVLIDPNNLNKNGTTAISGTFPSPSGKYLAYLLSDNGSDSQTLYVMNVETGNTHKTTIEGCRFTGVRWDSDEKGFRYTYPAADQKQRTVVKQHKIGRPTKHDEIVFEREALEQSFCSVGDLYHSRGKKNGMQYATVGVGTNSWNELWIKGKGAQDFDMIFKDEKSFVTPLIVYKGKLYAHTDQGAPRGRLVAIDPKNPAPENWEEIIPEHEVNKMKWVSYIKGDLMVAWTEDTADKITFHNLDGKELRQMPLPEQSTVEFGNIQLKNPETLVTIRNFKTAGDKYTYNFEDNSLTFESGSNCPVNLKDAIVERHFATSKDGTKVPMTVIRSKDTKLDGSAATKLYGYGGFNVPLTPEFNFDVYTWVSQGGVYVQANLRGGGEFGTAWYDAGRLENKQNVFDDMTACADYLVQSKITSPKRLAISGGSNGGLLTLATMLQAPEKFGGVISHVPVTDMFRFHKFTYGAAWKSDYGDVENLKSHFNAAAAYSPLHNVKPGTTYPPTLVMTGDNDDRVVPSHAYKFVATLNDTAPDSLGLLCVTRDAGHGAGKSKEKYVTELVQEYSFLEKVLGPIRQDRFKLLLKNKGKNATFKKGRNHGR